MWHLQSTDTACTHSLHTHTHTHSFAYTQTAHTSLGLLVHFTARLQTMNHGIKFMRRTHTHSTNTTLLLWPDYNLIVLSLSLSFPSFLLPPFLSHSSSCPPSSHLSIICHDSEWMKTKRRGIRLHGSSCPACHFLHPHCLCPSLSADNFIETNGAGGHD